MRDCLDLGLPCEEGYVRGADGDLGDFIEPTSLHSACSLAGQTLIFMTICGWG